MKMPRRPLTDEQREQSRKHRLECDRERQRKRRLNPVLRAIEQGRNTVAKRVSRAKGFYYDNIDILKANIGCSKMISMFGRAQSIKKGKRKERQRKRRMDPEFRAKERERNKILKRISRQKSHYTQEVLNCESCGEPVESDHICFSNILSVELHKIDVSSNNTIKKVINSSNDS